MHSPSLCPKGSVLQCLSFSRQKLQSVRHDPVSGTVFGFSSLAWFMHHHERHPQPHTNTKCTPCSSLLILLSAAYNNRPLNFLKRRCTYNNFEFNDRALRATRSLTYPASSAHGMACPLQSLSWKKRHTYTYMYVYTHPHPLSGTRPVQRLLASVHCFSLSSRAAHQSYWPLILTYSCVHTRAQLARTAN